MSGKSIRGRVTKAAVDRLLPGQSLRDIELKGFGVRRQDGAASYFLQRRAGGKLRWITIGQHGQPWTPETARREARQLLLTIAEGGEPLTLRQQRLEEPTVADIAQQFMASHGVKLKPRTRDEYQRLIDLHIVPDLGTRRVTDIAPTHVARFHAARAHIPSSANFAFAVLSKMMSWAETMGYRPRLSNPCRGTQKYRENKRERYLTRDEFARLGAALSHEDQDQESLFAVAAIRLLALTGARLSEILTLKWSYVDLERGLLMLPDSKTGHKSIQLNAAAIDVLALLPRLANNPYVIAGRRNGSHLINLQKPWRRIRTRAGLDDVRLHDLRHSFASVAAASKASLPMIGRLLGHTNTSTTARYAHLADDPMKKLNDEVGATIAEALTAKTT